jgi:hypothetical protein
MEMCYDTPCGTENTPENHECVANNPMIEKPDWDVVCHASAWDMYHAAKDDYRLFTFRKRTFYQGCQIFLGTTNQNGEKYTK